MAPRACVSLWPFARWVEELVAPEGEIAVRVFGEIEDGHHAPVLDRGGGSLKTPAGGLAQHLETGRGCLVVEHVAVNDLPRDERVHLQAGADQAEVMATVCSAGDQYW